MYAKLCKIFQTLKYRKTLYGCVPPKNIAELKPWDTVNVDPIVPYIKSIRKQNLGGAIRKNNVSLTCIMIINPDIGWFEIAKVPEYDLGEVMEGTYEYINK